MCPTLLEQLVELSCMNRFVYDFVFVQDKTFQKVNFYVDIQVDFEFVYISAYYLHQLI